MLLLLACAGSDLAADDVCASDFTLYEPDPTVRTAGFRLPADDGDWVHAWLRWPDGATEAEWPVTVTLHGTWETLGTPITEEVAYPSVAEGLVSLHLDLPDDHRGPKSRGVVSAALRYAAGATTDDAGCTVVTRTSRAWTESVLVTGISNGGNLAIATLADPDLDLPAVGGLVLWETPVAPVFANVELGNTPTVYEPGACSLAADRLTCDFPAGQLLVDAEEKICFDLDASSTCDSADVLMRGVLDPVGGKRMLSPELRAGFDAEEIAGYASAAEAESWWSHRDGSRNIAAMVAAWPDLAVRLVASEQDHVIDWEDHPHVFGLGEALQRAGARWTQLNDDAPNAPLRIDAAEGTLLTEDEEAPLPDALGAANVALGRRLREADW